ncbi:MobV family relaxase (plasmid) [Priestia flexa]|uniref:MobV family relaxase n=1 Tax=Priestia flexa TaxID=86664 RepID=UPI00240E7814|nr:MobV family relaxase [Priestia flexa]WEZ10428.1 MobV family relaxase [Priestia flexa]
MSFAICRMEKMKSHDLKGMQFHNQRERESKTNPDIDKERSHLNYDLVNPDKIDYNKRVKEIIESQKTGTRKTRKDAVLVNELLITSDRGFFDRLNPAEEKQFFEESYKLFADRYGEKNIAYAMVHMDEKTPHMHLGVVPMRDGKLQGKHVFDRNELRWIQDEFPKHLQKQGFDVERGEKGSDREHLTTQQFKAKTLKEQVERLESSLSEKQAAKQEIETSINEIEHRLSDLGKSLDQVKKVDEIDVKLEKKMGLFASNRVILERKDFEGIETLAKASEALKMENRQLKIENQKLHDGKDKLIMERDLVRNENMELKKENKQLKKENDFLKGTLERVKELYQEKLPELAKMVGYVKASFLDKAKEKLLKRYFTDDNEIKGAQKFALDKQEQEKQIQSTRKRNRDREGGLER